MAAFHLALEGEAAVFSWKDGQVYTEGYDLESEKAVLALTSFGKGIGVLLIAINDCCKSEAEFASEVKKFEAGQEMILSEEYIGSPEGHLVFEYFSYSPDFNLRWRGWGGLKNASLSERHYKRLLKDPELGIKRWMASLPQLPEKYFHPLLNLSREEVNHALAHNESCPRDVLEILAKDDITWLREASQEGLDKSKGLEV